jgi:hypothetical protein
MVPSTHTGRNNFIAAKDCLPMQDIFCACLPGIPNLFITKAFTKKKNTAVGKRVSA